MKRPFFKYPGSKWQSAIQYPKATGEIIVETFAGSACYSVRQAAGRPVVLIETNPEIIELWNYLISAPADEIAGLPTDLPIGEDIRKLGLPSHGAELLIRQWQRVGRNDCWTVSIWNGKNAGLWHSRTRDAIAEQVSGLKLWTVKNIDSLAYMKENTNNSKITWFVDPPYVSRPAFYAQKFNSHVELGNICKNVHGQVIACEAEGADWLPFVPFKDQVTGRRGVKTGSKKHSKEMVWAKPAS